jgi:DNA-binding XRE family transcriptional regulator
MKKTNDKLSYPGFDPVPFNPSEYIADRCAKDEAFKIACQESQDEFLTLDILLKARKAAGLTQAEIAFRMGMKPASLARIEASLGSRKHSPSLATLRKYAEACGMKLTFVLS